MILHNAVKPRFHKRYLAQTAKFCELLLNPKGSNSFTSNMEFQNANNSEFYIKLNQRIHSYFTDRGISKFANREFWVKATLLIALHITAYSGIFIFNDKPILQTMAYLMTGLSSVLIVFNIVHDASHGAVSKNKRVNQVLTRLGDWIGVNTYIWDIRHNVQHHSFTNVPDGDLIIDYVPLIRMSKHQKRKWFHQYQIFYAPLLYMLYSFYWVLFIDISLFMRKNICNLRNIKHPASEWLILITCKLSYITCMVILPWQLAELSLTKTAVLFLSSHLIAGCILSPVAVLGHFVEGPEFPLPENGILPGNWAEHELVTTIDFSPESTLVHSLTGGLNTHIAHHLFPKINHVHYLKITKIIEAFCLESGHPYRKEKFLPALRSHFRYLKGLS